MTSNCTAPHLAHELPDVPLLTELAKTGEERGILSPDLIAARTANSRAGTPALGRDYQYNQAVIFPAATALGGSARRTEVPTRGENGPRDRHCALRNCGRRHAACIARKPRLSLIFRAFLSLTLWGGASKKRPLSGRR